MLTIYWGCHGPGKLDVALLPETDRKSRNLSKRGSGYLTLSNISQLEYEYVYILYMYTYGVYIYISMLCIYIYVCVCYVYIYIHAATMHNI